MGIAGLRPAGTSQVEVKVNGKKMAVKQIPSSYIVVDRTWKNGDKIEVRYPMSLHLAPTNDNPGKAAVMYGPLVLAGVMGTEGMAAPAPFSDPHKYNDYYIYDYKVPSGIKTSLTIDKSDLAKSIKKVDPKRLIFADEKDGVCLEPLYGIHHQRYVVYWDIKQ